MWHAWPPGVREFQSRCADGVDVLFSISANDDGDELFAITANDVERAATRMTKRSAQQYDRWQPEGAGANGGDVANA